MAERLVFILITPRVGVRIGAKWATEAALKELLGFEEDAKIVVFDSDTNEYRPDAEKSFAHLSPDRVYLVSSENEVEDDSQEKGMTFAEFYERIGRIEKGQTGFIKRNYVQKHPELFGGEDAKFEANAIFDARLWSLVQKQQQQKEEDAAGWDELVQCVSDPKKSGLYTFPCLDQTFCAKLIEEVESYEASGLPVSRPNSMNNFGLILDLIGLRPLMTFIRETLISPLAHRFYSPDLILDGLDSHHAFVVQYDLEGDKKLDFHFDDSEVTLNVCLGRNFVGGDLFFRGLLDDKSTHDEDLTVPHNLGRALLHLGKHRHGANLIVSGERYNLIIWCRSSSYREKNDPACGCCCGEDHGHEEGHEHGYSHEDHEHGEHCDHGHEEGQEHGHSHEDHEHCDHDH